MNSIIHNLESLSVIACLAILAVLLTGVFNTAFVALAVGVTFVFNMLSFEVTITAMSVIIIYNLEAIKQQLRYHRLSGKLGIKPTAFLHTAPRMRHRRSSCYPSMLSQRIGRLDISKKGGRFKQ